jgi:tellurite resistance protein TerC
VDVPLYMWALVGAIIAVALALDLFVFHRDAHEASIGEAAVSSAAWVALGVAFGIGVWIFAGPTFAGEYFAGYVIEKSLSVDNIFVFALLLGYFAVPRAFQHRVLFWGVLGALVLRAGFIAAGAALLDRFHWAIFVFGAFLVLTGVRMLLSKGGEADPGKNPAVRLLRRVMRVTDEYHGQRLFWKGAATPMFAALVAIEATDVVFAVDSIPAVFAITEEPFLVFTSNAFAILGLRALYFLLEGMLHRFEYLKIGLSAVLVFVGAKMLVSEWWHPPILLSLGVIVAILTASIVIKPSPRPAGEDR